MSVAPQCKLWLCRCGAIIGHREGRGWVLVRGVTYAIRMERGRIVVVCWQCGKDVPMKEARKKTDAEPH